MRWLAWLALVALGVALGVGAAPAAAQPSQPYAQPYVEGQLIVRFRSNLPSMMLASAMTAVRLQTVETNDALDLQLVAVEPGREQALIELLSANPLIAYVGPNYRAHIAGEPNDPAWWRQWNLRAIGAPEAWDFSRGAGVTVAVIDTGVDRTHPELAGRLVAGYDFVNGDADPQDDHGHGTHVAGIIAAVGNNAVGIAGLAWEARIMPLKVLDARGDGAYFDIIQAIQYAADRGARVINLSLGGSQADPNLQAAVDYAVDRGCLVVAANGNQGGALLYPAAYDRAFAVAATTDRGMRPSYSNFGPGTDIAAPGGTQATGIYGLAPGASYTTQYGTSMAAPHVSALAALIWSAAPHLSAGEVQEIIRRTADKTGTLAYDGRGWNHELGYGQINAAAALRAVAGGMAAPSPTPTPRPWSPTATPSAIPTPSPTATPALVEISLRAGWNLVSLNVQPADQRIEVVMAELMPALEVVLGFRCGEGGLSYYPDLPASFSTLRDIQAGRGYWVRLREPRVWRVRGEPVPANAPLALCEGWNLAGYMPRRPYAVPVALATMGEALGTVLGFEDGQGLSYYAELPPSFNTLREMKPGRGYWIYARRPMVISYPAE